uniref:Uncharacterized protein n=1 Tax=Setaria italica TaxID=4555 RepID=K3Y466_SETIT
MDIIFGLLLTSKYTRVLLRVHENYIDILPYYIIWSICS